MVINIRPLSAALAERAQNELNEKPNEIEARINELREWILQQPHLKARTGKSSIRHDGVHESANNFNLFPFHSPSISMSSMQTINF